MHLDATTLLVVLVFVSSLLSALLLLSWLQNRAVTALAWWSLSFALGTFGIGLLAARGRIPDFFSIDIANSMTLLAYGLAWNSARLFGGRRGNFWAAAAGAALWLTACRIPVFYDTYWLRVVAVSLMISSYCLLSAFELWRGSGGRLATRRVTAVFIAGHGVFLLFRAPMAFAYLGAANPPDAAAFFGPVQSLLVFETLVFTISFAFLLLSSAKEQLELEHRRAALDDPLTGIANRRGFFAEAERVLAHGRVSGRPVALLVFDLDHFKAVNDSHGHQAGDEVLRLFAATVARELRAGEVVGRLGGEEFAALLPDANPAEAVVAAERIRAAIAALRPQAAAGPLAVTTSIGVAAAARPDSLDTLLAAADAALYRAKAAGRDRVECAVLEVAEQASATQGNVFPVWASGKRRGAAPQAISVRRERSGAAAGRR